MTHPPDGETPSPQMLAADIERQRAELAETVDALRSRLDVRSRAAGRIDDLRRRVSGGAAGPRPELIGLAAAVLVVGGLWWWRRRRS